MATPPFFMKFEGDESGIRAFERRIAAIPGHVAPSVAAEFGRLGEQINRSISGALSKKQTTGFLDIRELEREALAARNLAKATSEVADATGRLIATASRSGNQVEASLIAAYQAASALANGYERDVTAAEALLRVNRQINVELSRSTSGVRPEANQPSTASFEANKRAMAAQATEAQRLQSVLNSLTAEYQPLVAAQQRFENELQQADQLLAAGVIDGQRYGTMVGGIADKLTRTSSAFDSYGRSTRGVRQATVQAGQQLQDITISLQGGQRASTVLAQQLPQLAFALQDVGGKTGAVARFFAGPWGVALALGAFAVGSLIEKLLGAESASQKAERASRSLNEVLADTKSSYEEVTTAINAYNKASDKAREVTLLQLTAQANLTATNINGALAERTKLTAQFEGIKAYANSPAGLLTEGVAGTRALISYADAEIKKNELKLNSLLTSVPRIQKDIAAEQARILTDEVYARKVAFDLERAAASKRYDSLKDEAKLRKELIDINLREIAAGKQKAVDRKAATAATKAERDAATAERKATAFSQSNYSLDAIHAAVQFQESRGRPGAVSPKGAKGLMQVMDATARDPGYGIKPADLGNPADVARVGHSLLNALIRRYDGNLTLALSAYNGGTARLEGGKKVGAGLLKTLGDPRKGQISDADFARGIPNKENREYVQSIMKALGGGKAGNSLLAGIDRDAEQAAQALQRVGDAIANIAARYNDQGSPVDQQQRDIRTLDELAAAYRGVEDEASKAVVAAAELAKVAATNVFNQIPASQFKQYTDQVAQQAEINRLILDGKAGEAAIQAEIFQQTRGTYKISAEQEAVVRSTYAAQRLQSAELEKQHRTQQRQLDLVNSTQDNIRQTTYELLKGNPKAIGDAFKRQIDTYLQDAASQLTDSLFGDQFSKARDRITGVDRVSEAGTSIATTIENTVIPALNDLAKAAQSIANGDFGPDITVTARRPANDNKPVLDKRTTGIFGKTISDAIGAGFRGFALGQAIGSPFGKTGGTIGGVLGSAVSLGATLTGGKGAAGALLKTVSAALPEIGAVIQLSAGISSLLGNDQVKGGKIGGIIAPLPFALFGKALRGSATIGGVNGGLGITGTAGNSKGRIAASKNQANSIISGLESIADQLGLNLDASKGSVSVGIRKKKYVVDPTGQGRTKGAGVLTFGKDEAAAQEAARAATLDLIKDGILPGLRAGSQTLLANAKDLETGLSKVLKFQSVFTDLKAIKDPVGAAVDAINVQFTNLKTIFTQAGASAAEFAQLEELYGIKRTEAVKAATEQLTSSLKQLVDDLKIGDNGLSLRERLTNARKEYDPLVADYNAGKKIDFDKFSTAAKGVLDLQRQIDGSQTGYFTVFNDILALSEKMLAEQNALANGTATTGSPFAPATPSDASTPVVSAINYQTDYLASILNAINGTLGNIATAGKSVNDNAPAAIYYGNFSF